MPKREYTTPDLSPEALEALPITGNGEGAGHKAYSESVDFTDPAGNRWRGNINLWAQSPREQAAARGKPHDARFFNAPKAPGARETFSAAKFLAVQAQANAGNVGAPINVLPARRAKGA